MVSIIVVAYNSSKYLKQCLLSLINQTYNNIEIIVVDDGSTDTTFDTMVFFANSDIRIKIISQKHMGVSAARNIGMSKASGDYITFADSDDWVNNKYVEHLVRGISEEETDVSICGYYLNYPNNTFMKVGLHPQIMNGQQAIEKMLYPDGFQGFLWNKLFKASVIRDKTIRFDETLFYMEDLAFCAEYFYYCDKIKCVSYNDYYYRQHINSETCKQLSTEDDTIKKRETAIMSLNKVLSYCKSDRTRRLCKARIQTEYAEILRNILAYEGKKDVSKKYIQKIRRGLFTLLRSPLSVKLKIKQIGVALFPIQFSNYMINRSQNLFKEKENEKY